ncbi:hypothetical protein PDG61_16535 [Mycolicibacterium sp. BiH015]|uniref:hypothetical protein n=1 Tax=Mycolicibacterium sp. BiH015 TaxID=3018808 RepID=UPI0022E16C3E|nr:hypothetical protein [Mycolicibacterium sp. BiH015]MDA2892530.1 hypothetical protein [Mycolicibacterium sp. BiH015]
MTDAAGRHARRQAIRRHHPDAGGSAEALMSALEATNPARGPRPTIVVSRRTRTWRVLSRLARRLRRRRFATLNHNTFRQHSDTGGHT